MTDEIAMTSFQIRKARHDTVRAFRMAAGARRMTSAEYLDALVKLHQALIEDDPDSPILADCHLSPVTA